jgi:hypothetical protein
VVEDPVRLDTEIEPSRPPGSAYRDCWFRHEWGEWAIRALAWDWREAMHAAETPRGVYQVVMVRHRSCRRCGARRIRLR